MRAAGGILRALRRHIVFGGLAAGLGVIAFKVGYPDVSPLFAVYAISAVTLFEIASRFSLGRNAPRFWRTGRIYAVIIGLASLYLASDAHILEQSQRAYPADAIWFLAFFGSIALLGLVMFLRQPDRADMFVLEPRFTGNGVGLFVTAVTLQLFVMTALAPLSFLIVAYRATAIGLSMWFVVFGTMVRTGPVVALGAVFLLINALTAYLDLFWDDRLTAAFHVGAGVVGVLTIGAIVIWVRWLNQRLKAA